MGTSALIALGLWLQVTAASKPIIAYYAGWEGGGQVNAVAWDLLSQVNVAFAGINPAGQCAWMRMDNTDTPDNTGTIPSGIAALVAARNQQNPAVKIVLSVGGDSMSYRFSHATSTAAGVATLASSCVKLATQLGLDGIDYDWEYPGRLGLGNCPAIASAPWPCADEVHDAGQFTRLLAATRNLLGANRPLSAALFDNVPGQSSNVTYDYTGLQNYLTYLNLMVYDVHGWPGDNTTNFHAPFSQAQGALNWFAHAGIAPAKIILGVPYYGSRWTAVSAASVGLPGNSAGTLPYSDIIAIYGQDPQCRLYNLVDGAFYYCGAGPHRGDWVSVDGPAQLQAKAAFVNQNNFGGMMYWVIPGDTRDNQLTQACRRGLGSSAPSSTNAALVDILSDGVRHP